MKILPPVVRASAKAWVPKRACRSTVRRADSDFPSGLLIGMWCRVRAMKSTGWTSTARAVRCVAPHAAYPAVLFEVGANDHRVAPWMSGKMAARLLAATTSGRPILVRVDRDAGHGFGSTRDQAFAATADVYAFFLAAFAH